MYGSARSLDKSSRNTMRATNENKDDNFANVVDSDVGDKVDSEGPRSDRVVVTGVPSVGFELDD